ncbi:MAG: inorganic diphosphatase, partial [Verrucomicrobiota bacterium]
DLLVFGGDEKYEGMIRDRRVEPQTVRVIGLVKMEECDRLADEGRGCTEEAHWEQDWKVLAVDPAGAYADLTEAKDLPPEIVASFERFFSNYKGPEADKDGVLQAQTRVAGWMGKAETLETFVAAFVAVDPGARAKRVAECRALYGDRLASADQLPESPDYDPDFLGCLPEVHDQTFFETEAGFSFLQNYGAYQLLYLINKGEASKMAGITMANAVEHMQARRDDNFDTHFRLVSFDSPEPGLGTPVFEWVKTKNRNEGCPEGTPPQHYERRPLIDFDGLVFREGAGL